MSRTEKARLALLALRIHNDYLPFFVNQARHRLERQIRTAATKATYDHERNITDRGDQQ